jgi:hypothetical protein
MWDKIEELQRFLDEAALESIEFASSYRSVICEAISDKWTSLTGESSTDLGRLPQISLAVDIATWSTI